MALSHMKNCSQVLTTISWKYHHPPVHLQDQLGSISVAGSLGVLVVLANVVAIKETLEKKIKKKENFLSNLSLRGGFVRNGGINSGETPVLRGADIQAFSGPPPQRIVTFKQLQLSCLLLI